MVIIPTSAKQVFEENTGEHPYDTGEGKDLLTKLPIKQRKRLIGMY